MLAILCIGRFGLFFTSSVAAAAAAAAAARDAAARDAAWACCGMVKPDSPKINIKRGVLQEKGSIEIPITNNKEIKLTATNALGATDTHNIAITVSEEKPKIKLFKLDRDTLDNENPAQLDWNILGAKEINISNKKK